MEENKQELQARVGAILAEDDAFVTALEQRGVFLGEDDGLRLSSEAICRATDMEKVLARWPEVKTIRVGHMVKITLPNRDGGEVWAFNPQDGLLRNPAGETLNKIAFFARLTGLDYNQAALALATDPSLQREGGDDAVAAEEARAPYSFADLDLILPDIRWAWEPWLPTGMLSMLVGEVGVGKSALALAIAGIVARGAAWPDGALNGSAGLVVWCETESAEPINRQRMTDWGIPKGRVIIPAISDDPLDKLWLDTPEGWEALEREAHRPGVRLLIMDSLRGAYRGDENTSDTIELLGGLASVARDAQIAILIVHHLRKRGLLDGHRIDLDRVRGSSAIVQLPRCVWAIDRPDPLMPDRVRLMQIKNNLAHFPDPIGFEILPSGVVFGEAPSEPEVETQRDKAADLLLTLLADGPMPANEIYEEAEGAALSRETLKRAKKALGIVAKRQDNRWWWGLPAREQR